MFDSVVNWLVGKENDQRDWLLERAGLYREAGYMKEIPRRVNYLNEDMEKDGKDFLKEEFALSYDDMKYKLMEYSVVSLITRKRAQTFRGKGMRFYLANAKGEEVPKDSPIARSFKDMIEESQIVTSLFEIDTTEDICNGCAAKVWWDVDHLEISPYNGAVCHVAINPDRWWDPYTAYGVLFEQTGVDGFNSEPRYEVWATRDPKQTTERDIDGRLIFSPNLHYVSSKNGPIHVNDKDVNPYVDRYTKKPLMPFVWFASKKGEVYQKGGDQLVHFNRLLNLMMTYLTHNAIWQMAVSPVFELPAGQVGSTALAELKAVILSKPNAAIKVPPGVKFSFVRPDGQLSQFTDLMELLVQYQALMQGLTPRLLNIRGSLPQPGIAMQIEQEELIKYRNQRVVIMRPHVRRLLNVMISIWNARAPAVRGAGWVKIPENLYPVWDAGVMDSGPTDHGMISAKYQPGIETGVYSVDDWAAEVHGVTKDEARAIVDANLERNKEVLKMLTRYPDEPEKPEPDAEDVEPKAEAPDVPEKKAEAGGVDEAGADKIVANVYQIVKAIEVGAATAVDLRMALYPNESRQQAEAIVKENIEFNLWIAELLGKVRAVEASAAASGQPPTTKNLPTPKKPGEQIEEEKQTTEGNE